MAATQQGTFSLYPAVMLPFVLSLLLSFFALTLCSIHTCYHSNERIQAVEQRCYLACDYAHIPSMSDSEFELRRFRLVCISVVLTISFVDSCVNTFVEVFPSSSKALNQ